MGINLTDISIIVSIVIVSHIRPVKCAPKSARDEQSTPAMSTPPPTPARSYEGTFHHIFLSLNTPSLRQKQNSFRPRFLFYLLAVFPKTQAIIIIIIIIVITSLEPLMASGPASQLAMSHETPSSHQGSFLHQTLDFGGEQPTLPGDFKNLIQQLFNSQLAISPPPQTKHPVTEQTPFSKLKAQPLAEAAHPLSPAAPPIYLPRPYPVVPAAPRTVPLRPRRGVRVVVVTPSLLLLLFLAV